MSNTDIKEAAAELNWSPRMRWRLFLLILHIPSLLWGRWRWACSVLVSSSLTHSAVVQLHPRCTSAGSEAAGAKVHMSGATSSSSPLPASPVLWSPWRKRKKKKKENPSGLPAHMCRSCSVVTLSVSHSSRLCFTLKLRVAPRWGHLQAPGSTHLALIPYRSDAAPKNKRASLHKLPPARLPQWEKEQRD